jgi:hypothetical protein
VQDHNADRSKKAAAPTEGAREDISTSNDRDQPAGDPGAGGRREGGVIDRRLGIDRRTLAAARGEGESKDAKDDTGLERRRGPGRRLSDFTRRAEEGEMTQEQFLFLMAIDAFKKANNRPYPTWSDVLEVIRLLGYRKTMPMELTLRNAEDWRELADSPANVRPDNWHNRAA